VYNAMTRKAKALHVTGGQCFGYRNVDVMAPGPDGRMHRQYVRREVLPDEAAVVRRIFEFCAAGEGLKGITKTLNADGTPAPRSQRGRPKAWAPSSVREVLYRESYRGVVVWNKIRKRDSWGHKRPTDRPSSEWLRVEAESLRIVPETLWQAAHARLTQRRRITAQRAEWRPQREDEETE
jgi:site-specific DNA recombinase